MAKILPFRAVRPAPDRAAQVASVPYDVLDREEARRLAEGNPASLLRVSRPEIEFHSETDPYSDEVYARARENWQRIRSECMVREEKPSLYAYRLTMGKHRQTGLVAAYSIDEYDSGKIRKHERTRKQKEDDRTRHVLTLSAQTGPVFLTYRDVPEIDREIARALEGPKLYDFTAPDGVRHEAWLIADTAPLVMLFAERVGALYIADGHHRAAAASRARAESRSGDTGFLAVAFPASQLRILPYHRLVRDLGPHSTSGFLKLLGARFAVEPGDASEPPKGSFGMYLDAKWHRLMPKEPAASELDVDLLQRLVLGPLLGISDPRTDGRIDFMGGIRGTGELAARVDAGLAAVAFSLHPTRIEEVIETSDRGDIMPPKSTWFEPKLRDGLFSHLTAEP
jgi:uncharacterized protein (DUF1015 family)